MIRKFVNNIIDRPILNSLVIFILFFFGLYYLTTKYFSGYDTEFQKNILVNAHSILFDIIIFGVIIYYLNTIGERRFKIRIYQEEIDDFKTWQSDEAKFRILGNIRRLNRKGITNINLSNAILNDYCFDKLNLQGSFFSNALFNKCSFKEAILYKANFSYAKLNGTDFSNSFLSYTDFSNSDFTSVNLTNANLSNASLLGVKNLSAKQLSKAKSLFGVKIDESLKEEVIKLDMSDILPNLFNRKIFFWSKPHDSINESSHYKY